jgi:hypothetical protein
VVVDAGGVVVVVGAVEVGGVVVEGAVDAGGVVVVEACLRWADAWRRALHRVGPYRDGLRGA